MKINTKEIKAIFCTHGLGKTWLAKNDDRFFDMDLEHTRGVRGLGKDVTAEEIEVLKGGGDDEAKRNPTWNFKVENEIILSQINAGKTVIHACYEKCMKFLYKHNIPFAIVMADPCMAEEIKSRMRKRGNSEKLIEILGEKKIVKDYKKLSKNKMAKEKFVLKSGYLFDIVELS